MEFINCNSKKSKPKVHITVCDACKRRRSCEDYSRYRQPLLFSDLALMTDVRRKRKRRVRTKPSEPLEKQEQLEMAGILKLD